MIFFGHVGLTTLSVKGIEKIVNNKKAVSRKILLDYRFAMIGSILPDIIDKPIGAYFFRSTFHNSRIFAHTLIFSLLLIFIGLIRIGKGKKSNVLILGISTSIHLILDSMWLYSHILFWPYFGLKFPERPEGNWVQSNVVRLFTDPMYYLPELIGFTIITYYFLRLIKNKQLKIFIRTGKL